MRSLILSILRILFCSVLLVLFVLSGRFCSGAVGNIEQSGGFDWEVNRLVSTTVDTWALTFNCFDWFKRV